MMQQQVHLVGIKEYYKLAEAGVMSTCFKLIICLLFASGCSKESDGLKSTVHENKDPYSIAVTASCPVLASGQESSLWAGDDGALKLGAGSEMNDEERYVLRDDGILEDHLTGLMWMFKAPYWGGVMKESSYQKYELRLIDETNVRKYISEINEGDLSGNNHGYSDWRWPTLQEGISLFRFWGMSRRGLKKDVPWRFVHDLAGAAEKQFSTCTPFPGGLNKQYEVFFSGWKEIRPDGPDELIITPVRTMTADEARDENLRVAVPAVGPRGKDPLADDQWPSVRFKIYGLDSGPTSDDVVVDQLTGLVWARDVGASGDLSWFEALEYCEKLELGGYSDWRMPNIMEQLSVLCFGFTSPSLCNMDGDGPWREGDPFISIENVPYWSSTGYEMEYEKIYSVDLKDGAMEPVWVGRSPLNEGIIKMLSGKKNLHKVWPVRGGLQWGAEAGSGSE